MASTAKKPIAKRGKRANAARELGAIHEWMKLHEKADDRRFTDGTKQMELLATKDDISSVMVDQASKADVKKINDSLFTEDGQPKFATKEDMQPMLDLYKGSTFIKSFFTGASAFVISLVAVGFGIIQLISWIRGH